MKKIVLTEEQFRQYIKSSLIESIVSEKGATKLSQTKLDAVMNHMAKRAKEGDEKLLQHAGENGINIDSLKGELNGNEYRDSFNKEVNRLLDDRNQEINHWVKTYLQPLRDLYVQGNENKRRIVTNNRAFNSFLIRKSKMFYC